MVDPWANCPLHSHFMTSLEHLRAVIRQLREAHHHVGARLTDAERVLAAMEESD